MTLRIATVSVLLVLVVGSILEERMESLTKLQFALTQQNEVEWPFLVRSHYADSFLDHVLVIRIIKLKRSDHGIYDQ